MDGEKDMVRNVTRSPLAPVPTTTSQSICWALGRAVSVKGCVLAVGPPLCHSYIHTTSL